jgi:hypothetical protein
MLVALALAVATWGGGFDVLYALQDIEFDRSQRLHSLPAALGGRRSLRIARALHTRCSFLHRFGVHPRARRTSSHPPLSAKPENTVHHDERTVHNCE